MSSANRWRSRATGPDASGKLVCPGAAAAVRVAVVKVDFGVDEADDEPLPFDKAALKGLRSLSLLLTASNPAFFLIVPVGIIMQQREIFHVQFGVPLQATILNSMRESRQL